MSSFSRSGQISINLIIFIISTPSAAHVHGIVTDITTGLPIPDATVAATPGPNNILTDPDGRYDLALGQGTFTLTVTAPSFISQSIPITLSSAQSLTNNFQLSPVATPADPT